MLNFYSCYSKAVNPEKAVFESITKTAKDENIEVDLIILHSTLGHNLQRLLSAIKKAHPKAEVVGCTGSGVISNGWVNESVRTLAAMIITGDEFVTSSISGLTIENSKKLAEKCAKVLKNKNAGINMLMAFSPGVIVNADGVIAGIDSVFGKDVPILGGTSGFGGGSGRTPVFYGDQELNQSIVIVGFSDPSLEVIQVAHHGYLPQKDYSFKITKANGNQIDELNGEPAWPLLMRSFDLDINTSAIELIPILALGIKLNDEENQEYHNECILRAPLIVNNKKSFIMPAPVKEGTQLISCQRNEDYLFEGIKGIGERIKVQIGNRIPVAVFQMDCMARGRKTTGKIEKDEIINMLQDEVIGDSPIPWLGDYGFGEFGKLGGKNRFHNYTAFLSMIVRK